MEKGLVNVRIDKITSDKIKSLNIATNDGIRLTTFEQKIAYLTNYFINNQK